MQPARCPRVGFSEDSGLLSIEASPTGRIRLRQLIRSWLMKVLDSEVRSKLQAVFGLEVTDLPMEELRKSYLT